MADAAERHGFTPEQIAFLEKTFERKLSNHFDTPILMWLFGGLVVLGIAASGFLWTEIRSVRAELGTHQIETANLAGRVAAIEARQ